MRRWIASVIWWLRTLDVSADVVSDSWLQNHAKRGGRTQGYDGPSMRFPIQKIKNEASGFNRYLLRKKRA